MATERQPARDGAIPRRASEGYAFYARESEGSPEGWEQAGSGPVPALGARWGLLEGVRRVGVAPPARHRAYWDYELGNREGIADLERPEWIDLQPPPPLEEMGPGGLVSGFDGRGFAAPPRRSLRGVGPRSFRRSDERLRDEAWERLANDPDLDASRLTVEVADGEVALRGAVDDPRDRAVAEEICAEIHGVRGVYNRIRIEGTRPGWKEIRWERPT